jgi:hypothetical protein
VLHDNEAVIPLSRGRKVPVELGGKSTSAREGVTVNQYFSDNKSAETFRRSKRQVETDTYRAMMLANARNG